MTLDRNAPSYDSITHRPTVAFIKSQAEDHVAYGWTSRPGTFNRDIVWTDEDTETYMKFYHAALRQQRRT